MALDQVADAAPPAELCVQLLRHLADQPRPQLRRVRVSPRVVLDRHDLELRRRALPQPQGRQQTRPHAPELPARVPPPEPQAPDPPALLRPRLFFPFALLR